MTSSQEIRKPQFPKYRVESRRGGSFFVICYRVVRSFRFEYRCHDLWGRFETREAAQAFLDAQREAA